MRVHHHITYVSGARLRPMRTLVGIVSIAIVTGVFVVMRYISPVHALTTTPTTLNFQGRLLDSAGAPVADGLYNMKFALYTVSTGGSSVWNETRENNGTDYRVQVTNGLFTTKLGQASALSASLFASGTLYFDITQATPATATCSTAGCASWESPMTPRHQLSTSAYAFNSETLDGLDSTAFAQLGTTNTFTSTNTIQTTSTNAFKVQNASSLAVLTADTSGNQLQIGSATTDANAILLGLDSYNNGTDPTGFNGAIYYNTSLNKLRCYENAAWANCTASAANVIQNQNVAQQTTANFWINGTGRADTSLLTPTVDTASTVALNIGASSSVINLNKATFVVASVASAAEFSVQDGTNGYMFNVDGTNMYTIDNGITMPGNLLENPSFEADGSGAGGSSSMGWTGTTSGVAIVTDATNAHSGSKELQITANGTSRTLTDKKLYMVVPGDTVYVEGWSKIASGTVVGNAMLGISYYDSSKAYLSNTTVNANATTTYGKVSTTGTVPAGAMYAKVTVTVDVSSTSGTWYFDDILFAKTNQSQPMSIRPVADLANVFEVQNAAGANTLSIDTTNNRIVLGASDTTGVLLVLDDKTSAGDPTGVNGAMYYNSNLGKFRCYESGAWKNCVNVPGTVDVHSTTLGTTAATVAKAAAATILVTPTYIPGTITVNEFRIRVTTTLGATGDIGLYDSSGNLVLNGGSGSLGTATGVRTVAPVQTNKTVGPGQYYVAITWNSATGVVAGVNLVQPTMLRNGTLSAGGGSVLPSTITLGSITDDQYMYSVTMQ